jgi:hypothetical protein
MKITKRQLKRIIKEEYSKLKRQGLIRESNYGYGGHVGGTMAGHSGRGSDMPLPEYDTSIINWRNFKDAVLAGRIEEAFEFLEDIGYDDRMDQESFLADAKELTAEQLFQVHRSRGQYR